MLTPEDIESNWKRFRSLCGMLGDRTQPVCAMLDELEERLCLCPASARTSYHGAYPGGLVDHSLRVLNNVITLNKSFGFKLPKESMIIASLFHDIGKVGLPGSNAENDFYVVQNDTWKRDKFGEEYTYNDKLKHMTTPDRSVFVMQHYGIKLSADEWLAIKLNDGFVYEPNKSYCLKISPLVYVVMTADYMATMEEKPGSVEWVPD